MVLGRFLQNQYIKSDWVVVPPTQTRTIFSFNGAGKIKYITGLIYGGDYGSCQLATASITFDGVAISDEVRFLFMGYPAGGAGPDYAHVKYYNPGAFIVVWYWGRDIQFHSSIIFEYKNNSTSQSMVTNTSALIEVYERTFSI